MIKIYILIGCIALCSCSQKAEPMAMEAAPLDSASNMLVLTEAQISNGNIETGKPEMRLMSSHLRVNGLIDVPPQNMVTVSFPMGGYIKSTDLLPGMSIRKGQTLAVVQDAAFVQLQEDYLVAQTKLALLQKEIERQRTLNTTKATSDKVFEQTASDYKSQKIMVSALRQRLLLIGIVPERLTDANIRSTVAISSPINGFISSVNVNRGKYVNPSDVLFELVNTSDLHLTLTVFEKDVAQLHPGQQVEAFLTSDTAKSYPAEILLVSKTVDSNRAALVHCHFKGATPSLLPGTFMNAEIQVSSGNVISVPEDAVVRSGSAEYVFVQIQPKQFRMTPVHTLETQNGFVALSAESDNLLDQTIISKNAYAALMKLKNTGSEDE